LNVTRLLVADDSETVLLMMRRRLELAGYDVITATDGEDALGKLEHAGGHETPDLILLDAMMPRMSGVEVLERLRASGSEIPVLIISAHLDAPDEPERMEAHGADGWVGKPFDWDELLARIEELAGTAGRG
jgi:DNA-binding response OmpR family regulator